MSNYNPETIGVTWPAGTTSIYQRTPQDIKMDMMFNPEYRSCGPPPRVNEYEAFSFRTNFDKGMLAQFDQEYRDNKDVREAFRENYQPRHSPIYDDPYRLWSYKTLQPNMN